MRQLISLTDHLIKAGFCSPEQIDSWTENGEFELNGETTATGIYPFDYTYQGIIILQEVSVDLNYILGLVSCWLLEHDPERERLELGNPSFSGDPFDDGTSDLEIRLKFYEKPHYSPGTGEGAIIINSISYIPSEYSEDVAEELEGVLVND